MRIERGGGREKRRRRRRERNFPDDIALQTLCPETEILWQEKGKEPQQRARVARFWLGPRVSKMELGGIGD